MDHSIMLVKQWDDGELYAREGYGPGSAAIKVVWGFSTGSDEGIHCESDTFAEAVLGHLNDDLCFVPDVWTEDDFGKTIRSRSRIGCPRECEGWGPLDDKTNDNSGNDTVDWDAYAVWIAEYTARLL